MLWKNWLAVLRRARVPEARTAVLYFLEDLVKREDLQLYQNEEFKVGNREVSVLQPSLYSVQSRLLNICKCHLINH